MNNQNNLKEEVKRYIAECGYDGLDTEMEVEDIASHFAKWKEEQMIEKACEWLKDNMYNYLVAKADGADYRITIFNDFKQAMMEE